MDATIVGAGIIGLLVGVVLGRWSARGARSRVVWVEPARRVSPGEPLDEQIDALIRAGRKIHAIKRHRELYGTDLRQARLAIDEAETRLLGS